MDSSVEAWPATIGSPSGDLGHWETLAVGEHSLPRRSPYDATAVAEARPWVVSRGRRCQVGDQRRCGSSSRLGVADGVAER